MPRTTTSEPPANDRARSPWVQLVLALPLYFACLLMAGLLWPRPLWMTGLAVVLSIAVLWRWRTREDVLYYVVPFVLGPTGEMLAVHLGAWSYTDTPLIPTWLPFLWGLAGVFMRRATVALCQLLGDGERETTRP